MKKYIFFTAIFTISFSACKKGDEDPSLVLKTRKTRLCQEWNMSNFFYQYVLLDDPDSNNNITQVGDAEKITEVNNLYSGYMYTYEKAIKSYSITFNKDGSWKMIREFDVTETKDEPFYVSNVNLTYLYTEEGNWSFVGKNKEDYKNKERLMLNTSIYKLERSGGTQIISPKDGSDSYENEIAPYTNTINYDGKENITIYDLIKLDKDEMKWELVSGRDYRTETFIPDSVITYTNEYNINTEITWTTK